MQNGRANNLSRLRNDRKASRGSQQGGPPSRSRRRRCERGRWRSRQSCLFFPLAPQPCSGSVGQLVAGILRWPGGRTGRGGRRWLHRAEDAVTSASTILCGHARSVSVSVPARFFVVSGLISSPCTATTTPPSRSGARHRTHVKEITYPRTASSS